LAAAWADDFHHALHVALTGETSGYYEDFAPPALDPLDGLVSALRSGWHYGGRDSKHRGRKHGTPAAHLPGRRFVFAAQNHDQIGNRARGNRLTALTSPGGLRVAAALTALSPALPLFFQGEEWAAPEPFQYFVSHGDPALVEAVRKGRREEFKQFSWAGEVPDPQDEQTFLRSKIDRAYRSAPAGRAALRWHRDLLALRREHPALQDDRHEALEARREGPALVLRRWSGGKEIALVVLFSEEDREVALPPGSWRTLLDSGAEPYAVPGARPAQIEGGAARLCGRHAVVLERAA
jgi:maltooligosyltrehalose trehalohydrolase